MGWIWIPVLFAAQVVWMWFAWKSVMTNVRTVVRMGKRSARWLRWMFPLSAAIGLALVLLAGWGSGGWIFWLALWPVATVIAAAGITGLLEEPVTHGYKVGWYIWTFRWRRAYRLLQDRNQVLREWHTWNEYLQVREREGEERALKWLATMTREHPLSYRVPVHFDPELPRKLEEAERRAREARRVGG